MSSCRVSAFASRARDCERRAYKCKDYEYREWLYIKERQYADMALASSEPPQQPEAPNEAEPDKP